MEARERSDDTAATPYRLEYLGARLATARDPALSVHAASCDSDGSAARTVAGSLKASSDRDRSLGRAAGRKQDPKRRLTISSNRDDQTTRSQEGDRRTSLFATDNRHAALDCRRATEPASCDIGSRPCRCATPDHHRRIHEDSTQDGEGPDGGARPEIRETAQASSQPGQ